MRSEEEELPVAYHEFAYFYDEFNGGAEYDAPLCFQIKGAAGCPRHPMAFAGLGCGTGDLTPDADAGRL